MGPSWVSVAGKKMGEAGGRTLRSDYDLARRYSHLGPIQPVLAPVEAPASAWKQALVLASVC